MGWARGLGSQLHASPGFSTESLYSSLLLSILRKLKLYLLHKLVLLKSALLYK